MASERLQKLIARAGLCSRRDADRMIADGRVTVNGRTAELGDKADPETDHVKVDGKRLRAAEPSRYVLLYKPRAVMTTCDDPEERTTVIDLVRPVVKERVFPVGRLDYHSEGLLLLTNDGDLAARVTHPRYGVVREYQVKIRGDLDEGQIRQLRSGAVVDGHRVKPLAAERLRTASGGASTWWRVEVTEGRTHEV
ncbi:MAG: rRNA pseudouridine synthase, partial [Thermoanaerobaculales bacterium]|nr:rRNA pseudouridine synthase [Thermoanaerobaculales bacterium]